MIISSWNVNSVRARISNILDYLKSAKPDIILMQEIKTEEKNFPFNDFKKNLYDSHVLGQKSYNGVAIVSKVKIDNVNTNLILFSSDFNFQSLPVVGVLTFAKFFFIIKI